jgi:hypothetical protein
MASHPHQGAEDRTLLSLKVILSKYMGLPVLSVSLNQPNDLRA